MSAVNATARSSGTSLRQEVRTGNHVVAVDEPACLGGTDTAPSPYQLLGAALASCVLLTMRMYADRKGWELGDTVVDVCLDRDDDPTSATVTLRLSDRLSDEQQDRLRRVAKACPVSKTLSEGMVFEHGEAMAS
jgi:putative redox protein